MGWTRGSGTLSQTGVIDHEAPFANKAKQGRQWLGHAIGQRLGSVYELVSAIDGADRLFVSFTLSSLQSKAGVNHVGLTVALYVGDSQETWEGGSLISLKSIQDLTNDSRGDLNSYIDAYAILKLENARAKEAGFH